MAKEISKYLLDVAKGIEAIQEEPQIRGAKFEILCNDRVYRGFVERNISIIGEAMNQVLKLYPEIPITAARKIVNTRNLVIHSYDSIDLEIIWGIVIKHLPILYKEVREILRKRGFSIDDLI